MDYTLLGEARIFHTDGLFTEASLAAARKAKEKKVLVSVDAGSLREGMEDLAGLSDVFIASEVFADAFAGQGNALDACRRIAALGPSVAAVTLGSRGYVAIADGEVIEGSAYSVEAVDTTGCGDVFHGGYIHGLLEGWTTVECLDFAAWAAAMASLRLGGRAGIPDAGLCPGSGRGR